MKTGDKYKCTRSYVSCTIIAVVPRGRGAVIQYRVDGMPWDLTKPRAEFVKEFKPA